MSARARCPICRAAVRCFRWQGRMIFEAHGGPIHEGEACEATGWLVEDEDREAWR